MIAPTPDIRICSYFGRFHRRRIRIRNALGPKLGWGTEKSSADCVFFVPRKFPKKNSSVPATDAFLKQKNSNSLSQKITIQYFWIWLRNRIVNEDGSINFLTILLMHLILSLIYAVGNLQEFKNFKEFKNSVGYKLLCILSLPSSFTIRFLSQIQKYWIVIFWDKELDFFCFRNASVAGYWWGFLRKFSWNSRGLFGPSTKFRS